MMNRNQAIASLRSELQQAITALEDITTGVPENVARGRAHLAQHIDGYWHALVYGQRELDAIMSDEE